MKRVVEGFQKMAATRSRPVLTVLIESHGLHEVARPRRDPDPGRRAAVPSGCGTRTTRSWPARSSPPTATRRSRSGSATRTSRTRSPRAPTGDTCCSARARCRSRSRSPCSRRTATRASTASSGAAAPRDRGARGRRPPLREDDGGYLFRRRSGGLLEAEEATMSDDKKTRREFLKNEPAGGRRGGRAPRAAAAPRGESTRARAGAMATGARPHGGRALHPRHGVRQPLPDVPRRAGLGRPRAGGLADINYLDTAVRMMGTARARPGWASAGHAPEDVLATKVPGRSRTRDAALKEVEASLKRLQTDHLDLLHLHSLGDEAGPREDRGPGRGDQGPLRAARQQKVTRFIGMTSHTNGAVMAKAIERNDLDCVQMAMNPARRHRSQELALPAANRKNNLGDVPDEGTNARTS